jgi:hypothetical protein
MAVVEYPWTADMRSAALIVVISFAVACRGRAASWEMHADHAGAIRFGMPAADAMRALGDSTTAIATTGCTYWRPPPGAAPRGVSVMIENGVAVRADVDSAGPATAEGIGIASTEAAIRAAYGQYVTVQLHKYQWEAGWRYFIYLPPQDSLNAIVFETDGKTVQHFRVGRRPQVQYAERCG